MSNPFALSGGRSDSEARSRSAGNLAYCAHVHSPALVPGASVRQVQVSNPQTVREIASG